MKYKAIFWGIILVLLIIFLALVVSIFCPPAYGETSLYLAYEGTPIVHRPGDSFAVWTGFGSTAESILGVDYGFDAGALPIHILSADLSSGPFSDPNFLSVPALDYGGTLPDVTKPLVNGNGLIGRYVINIDPTATVGVYQLTLPNASYVGPDFQDHAFGGVQQLTVTIVPESAVLIWIVLLYGFVRLWGRRD